MHKKNCACTCNRYLIISCIVIMVKNTEGYIDCKSTSIISQRIVLKSGVIDTILHRIVKKTIQSSMIWRKKTTG